MLEKYLEMDQLIFFKLVFPRNIFNCNLTYISFCNWLLAKKIKVKMLNN